MSFYDEERERERARIHEKAFQERIKQEAVKAKNMRELPKVLFLKISPYIIGGYLMWKAYLHFLGRG